MKPLSRTRKVESALAYAAISKDDPPAIWHIAWVREHLERQDLPHIRVRIVPVNTRKPTRK